MSYLTTRKNLKLQLTKPWFSRLLYDIQPENGVCLFWDTTHTPDPQRGWSQIYVNSNIVMTSVSKYQVINSCGIVNEMLQCTLQRQNSRWLPVTAATRLRRRRYWHHWASQHTQRHSWSRHLPASILLLDMSTLMWKTWQWHQLTVSVRNRTSSWYTVVTATAQMSTGNSMVNVDLYSALSQSQYAEHTLVSSEKPGSEALSKGLIVLLCAKVVRQGVPDHRAVHSECLAANSNVLHRIIYSSYLFNRGKTVRHHRSTSASQKFSCQQRDCCDNCWRSKQVNTNTTFDYS